MICLLNNSDNPKREYCSSHPLDARVSNVEASLMFCSFSLKSKIRAERFEVRYAREKALCAGWLADSNDVILPWMMGWGFRRGEVA